jgi:hypothetical protein
MSRNCCGDTLRVNECPIFRSWRCPAIVSSSRAVSSLTTIYTSTARCHQHKIQLNFSSILETMQQTSECVGKLNVEDINADRFSSAVRSPHRCLDRSYHLSYIAEVAALPIRCELIKRSLLGPISTNFCELTWGRVFNHLKFYRSPRFISINYAIYLVCLTIIISY